MKQDKRKKRSKVKKAVLNNSRARRRFEKSQLVKSELAANLNQNQIAETRLYTSEDIEHSPGLLGALEIAFSNDSFTPTLISKILSTDHWEVNYLIEGMGLQTKKEVGKQRLPTESGQKHFSQRSGTGLKWKYSLIEELTLNSELTCNPKLISSQYRTMAILNHKGIKV